MDIVGLLARSRSDNQFILVICDYATRYPHTIPLQNTDATHIAEELVMMFAWVGVPQEILMGWCATRDPNGLVCRNRF